MLALMTTAKAGRRGVMRAGLLALLAPLTGPRRAEAARMADPGPAPRRFTLPREAIAAAAHAELTIVAEVGRDGSIGFVYGPSRREEAAALGRRPRPLRTVPIGSAGPPAPGRPMLVGHLWRDSDDPRRTCDRCDRCTAGRGHGGVLAGRLACLRIIPHPADAGGHADGD